MKYNDIIVKMSKQLVKAAGIAKCVSNLACLEEDDNTGLLVYKAELFDDKIKVSERFYLNKNGDYSNYNFGYYDDIIKNLLKFYVSSKYEQ